MIQVWGYCMKYRTKEVSRITGIPVDTLRYYEKIGVISPKIDEKNHYRYYNAWDINFLFEYINYRKMEYSSKEAIHYIHFATLQEQIEMAEKQKAFYQEKCGHYQMLLGRNRSYLEAIKTIEGNLNKISFCTIPTYKYILYRQNYHFYNSKKTSEEISLWLDYIGLTENVVIIPKETILSTGENEYYWGLMLREDWYNQLHLEKTDNIQTMESRLCVKTLVEAYGEGTFSYHLLDEAIVFLKEHNFELAGDPFGILLTRSHDDQSIHRYIEFYLPVQI